MEILGMRIHNVFYIIGILVLLTVLFVPEVEAQCPMCRMSAESNMENGGTAGAGLNNGILYMLALPYLIVGTIAFLWWRNRRKNNEPEDTMV
jgi:hypothetical protein